MVSVPVTDDAEIMTKEQISVPRDIRRLLNLNESGMAAFVCEGGDAAVINANVGVLRALQKTMDGEAERSGLTTEDDIIALCREVRAEVEGL